MYINHESVLIENLPNIFYRNPRYLTKGGS
jgi:hypothetical protein